MKKNNGGRGMTDEAVKLLVLLVKSPWFGAHRSPLPRFVDRYIPGYVFFGDGVTRGYADPAQGSDTIHTRPRWADKSLRLYLDENREVTNLERF